MKKIGTENVTVINWCPKRDDPFGDDKQPLSQCDKCEFFGGMEEDKVICHRAGLPLR